MKKAFQIFPWILTLVAGYIGFQFGERKLGKIESLTAWSLIHERVNGGLSLLEIYERKDYEDFLKLTAGPIVMELEMLGDENYAYSEIRKKYFADGAMGRIRAYANSHPDSLVAQQLNDSANNALHSTEASSVE